MTAQEFIDWVQNKNKFFSRTSAVRRASNMMHVTQDTIWKWLSGKQKTPPSMSLLMELLHEKYKEKRIRLTITDEQYQEMLPLLGKKTDTAIAEELGIPAVTVYQTRKKLGIYRAIKLPVPEVDQKELIDLLGKETDAEIAKKFGYSKTGIALIRKNLGIKSFRQSKISPEQYEEIRKLLGKEPDTLIAEKFGCSDSKIALIRKSLKIDAFRQINMLSPEQYEKMLPLLGKEPDKVIAEKLGIKISTVRYKRLQLGIKRYTKKHKEENYPQDLIKMLGKAPDTVIAEKFGYSRAGICFIRKNLGIKSFTQNRISPEKKEKMLPLLGKEPDKVIAEKFGIPCSYVKQYRKKLGIKISNASIKKEDESMILDLLGKTSDLSIAKKTGYSIYTIIKFRKEQNIEPFSKNKLDRLTPKDRKKLLSMIGKNHDKIIAEKFDISSEAVRRIRIKMNIPALREEKNLEDTIKQNKDLIALLGTMTDKNVADKTGISIQVIGKIRRKLNIPSFDKRGRNSKSTDGKNTPQEITEHPVKSNPDSH